MSFGTVLFHILHRMWKASNGTNFEMESSLQVNNLQVVEEQSQEMVLESPTRKDEGLPENAFVFGHFNTLRKVSHHVAHDMSRIRHGP